MPRIDPHQLLNCLQVLLNPSGGILSRNEVQRLANLMTKFSKKLVSKCIYVLILKNTERQLLGSFMGEGGWCLIHTWLQDAQINKNWALVSELLELLLVTPVDVERLKINSLPKLVKGLSRREDLPGIQQLASMIVDQWLALVKDVTKQEQQIQQQLQPQVALPTEQVAMAGGDQAPTDPTVTMFLESCNDPEPMEIDETISNDAQTIVSENGVDTTLRIKFVRDGKKVISKVVAVRTEGGAPEEAPPPTTDEADAAAARPAESEGTDKENSDKKQTVPKKSSSSSSKTSSSSGSSRDKDKDKDKDRDRSRDKSKSSSSSSRSSSSRSSSSRDKDRRDRDKDRHKHNGSSSSSSSKHRSSSKSSSSSSKDKRDSSKDSKDAKEKQAEKDKDTLAKIQPQTLAKVGRIPKKGEDSKKEPKKSSFSVEVRKNTEEKPKTVKVFNSKLRSTGLMEEARPPPPRSATKKTATPPTMPAALPAKRASPARDSIPPPEKKSRLMDADKGIKLIPPKPKPAVLQESDIFMDALTASATTKKEPKKRKRRTSTSKDSSPPPSPSKQSTPSSPTVLKNITPANFYQDTLVTDNDDDAKAKSDGDDERDKENKSEDAEDKDKDGDGKGDDDAGNDEPTEETTRTDANGLKGVLSYAKRKGPKRSIRWRPDAELVEVQYFELDETERVNVMKPFMDMQRMEMNSEREALRQRKLPNEDVMDAQTMWKALIEIECPLPPAELGSKSVERDVQLAREKTVLQALYFNRVPDTPAEPDHEAHASVPPTIIPLTDPDQPEQEALVQPWPEAKGSPPHVPNAPTLFSAVQPPPFLQAPSVFPPNGMPQFTPPFVPPGMLNRPPGEWNLLNGMPGKFAPPGGAQVPPQLFDNFGVSGPGGPMGPGGPDNFAPPFQNGGNPMPQMFPPNNFNNNMRGRGGFRRGGPNNGPWLRMGAPNQGGGGGGWNNNQGRGRGFCNSFKQKGYCRNRDNCPYIH